SIDGDPRVTGRIIVPLECRTRHRDDARIRRVVIKDSGHLETRRPTIGGKGEAVSAGDAMSEREGFGHEHGTGIDEASPAEGSVSAGELYRRLRPGPRLDRRKGRVSSVHHEIQPAHGRSRANARQILDAIAQLLIQPRSREPCPGSWSLDVQICL